MTAESFGAPGIDFHADTRVQRQPRTPEPTPEPAPGEVPVGRSEQVTVVLGEGLGNWIAGKLAGQPWYAAPQPSFVALIEHAKTGEWTVTDRARTRRLVWLWGPAALARAGAWSILRMWLRNATPRFGDDQPPIRDLLIRARESGWGPLAWVSLAYLPARIVSQIADYATRAGVALLLLWLVANAVGFPDVVTVTYWWDHIAALWASAPDVTAAPPRGAPPSTPIPPKPAVDSSKLASDIGQLVFFAAVIGGAVWIRLRNRNKSDTPPSSRGGGSTP